MAVLTASEAADAARHRLGVGVDGPLPDPLRLLEDEAGLAIFVLPLPRDGGIDGAYVVDRGKPFILVNQNGHPAKKRFTLAHEYGHHYLQHGPRWDQAVNPLDARSDVEREANDFASAFLMPRTAVDQWFGAQGDPRVDLEVLVRFAYFFNVSAPAALVRLSTLKRLPSANAYRTLAADLKAQRHGRLARKLRLEYDVDSLSVEHKAGGHVPTRVQRKLVEGIERQLLDETAVLKLLHLPPDSAAERLSELRAEQDTEA
jgi:Zn-dependent peptidase ImmA (M78 family)